LQHFLRVNKSIKGEKMRKTVSVILGFMLLAGLLVGVGAACSGSGNEVNAASHPAVNVDSSYTGKQVELVVGQTLVVTLDSNATTGYSWSLSQNSDDSILSNTGNEYIAPQTTLVGAPGKEAWSFEGLKKGNSIISMEYSRPWESTPPAQTFDLTVVVQ
jgi:inhibitor of cysteine peptidase